MKYCLIVFCLTVSSLNAHSETVREWWVRCKGNYADGTCLSEAELSKFKTICSSKNYKDDCRMVVDFVVASARISEAKKILLSGHASQQLHYAQNKKYLMDPEKIWNQDTQSGAFSFAIGVLPSCNSAAEKTLVFGGNLRSEIRVFKKEIIKIYNSLLSLPCSDSKKGFVLVAIGKTNDLSNEYEVLTIDENRNYKVIHSTMGPGPFVFPRKINSYSQR